jgi:hypothetical protein
MAGFPPPPDSQYTVADKNEAIDALLTELSFTYDAENYLHSEEAYIDAKKEAVGLTSEGVSIFFGDYFHEAIPVK